MLVTNRRSSKGKELGDEEGQRPVSHGICSEGHPCAAKVWGLAEIASLKRTGYLRQAEGEMTLLTWLGLKSDVSFTETRDAVSVCAAAPPGCPQLDVDAERMEPIPPG